VVATSPALAWWLDAGRREGYLLFEAIGHGVHGALTLARRVGSVLALAWAHTVGIAALALAALAPDLAGKLSGFGGLAAGQILTLAASIGLAAAVLLQIIWDDSGKGSGRVSMAAAVCCRPGARPRMFYRLAAHRGRKGERRSLAEDDYAKLITGAHHQLNAPLIWCWDNLNSNHSRVVRRFLDAHVDWLTVVALTTCTPTSTRPKESGPTPNASWPTTPLGPPTCSPPRSRRCSNASSTGPT